MSMSTRADTSANRPALIAAPANASLTGVAPSRPNEAIE
jgi:hypothetical protein